MTANTSNVSIDDDVKQDDSSTAGVPDEKTGLSILNKHVNRIRQIEATIANSEKKTNKSLAKIEDKVRKADESVDLKIAELRKDQINVIQTLSIFVAFFTFVSVEFKVLTSSSSDPVQVTGFTLILLGSLMMFVLLIDFVLNTKLSFKKTINHDPETGLSIIRKFTGYTEDIDFKWFSPSTWGDAFKIKFLPLMLVSISLICTGLYLIAWFPEKEFNITNDENESLNKSSSGSNDIYVANNENDMSTTSTATSSIVN